MTIEERRKLQEAIRHNRIKKSSDTASENKTTDKYSGLREAVRNGRIKTQPSSAPSTEALQTVEPLSVEEKEDIKAGAISGLAPKTETKAEKDPTYFKAGAFEDGYQAGDVTKSVLSTVGDVGIGAVHGVASLVEGITDLGLYGVSGISKLIGANDFANKAKELAIEDSVGTVADAVRESTGIKDNSLLGDKGYGIAQAVGQVGGIVGTAGLGGAAGLGAKGASILTSGLMGASSTGSGIGEAYQGGATDGQAAAYGIAKGVIDAGSELIFGGLGKAVNALGISRGISSLDDQFAKLLSNKISNRFFKNAVQYGVKASAEGLEEVLAGIGSAAAKNLTYMPDKSFRELLKDENLLDQFVTGTVASGIAQTGGLITSTKGNRDFITGLTPDQEAAVKKETAERVSETEKKIGMKLSNKQYNEIYDNVVNDLYSGALDKDEKQIVSNSTIKAAKDGNKEKTLASIDSTIEAERKLRDNIRNNKNLSMEEKKAAMDEVKNIINEQTTLKDTLRNADWSDKENINKILNIRPETGEESRIDDLEKNEAAEAEAEREAEATREATVNATAQNEAVATESTPTEENAVESDSESVGEGIVTEAEPTKATDSFEVTEDAENGTVEVKFKHKTADHPVRNVLKENNFTWNKSKHAWVGKADANTFTDSLRKAYSAENVTPETVGETEKTVGETAVNASGNAEKSINPEKIESIQGINPENIDSTEESTFETSETKSKGSSWRDLVVKTVKGEANEKKHFKEIADAAKAEGQKQLDDGITVEEAKQRMSALSQELNKVSRSKNVNNFERLVLINGIQAEYSVYEDFVENNKEAVQTAQETPTEAKETKPTETTPEAKNAENGKEEAKTEATESKPSDATAKTKRKGKLHNDIAPKNKRQKESLKVLEVLAEALGVDIYTFESPVENGRRVGENGRYDTKTGNIYIDLYAGNNGESVMLYTAAHELTHFIRQWSPDKYNVFTDFLIKQYGKKGVSVDDLVQAQIDKAKNSKTHPRELSYDEALEEVVADSCQAMLTDTDVVSKIAELKAKDESLWAKVRDFFIDLADRIRAAYENLAPYSAEGRVVADMLETAEQLKDMWMGALVEASENYNADGIITEGAVITDENGVKRSIRSMKQDLSEGKMFEDLKTYCGYTEEKVDALRRQIEDLVEFMIPYRKTVDMNEEYGKKERKYSPFKPNSDPLYKVSLDFSTLCTKRLLTQHIIEELQVQQSRALSAEEQLAIRDMLIEYEKQEKGIQVACAMCYVEAARLKSPKQINKWLDDIEKPLRNYFADKNSEFAATIKKAQEDFKESRGYSRDAAKNDMENKDVKELNKIRPRMRENYKPSNEEMEIIRRAKQLPRETFLKAENLATLSENEPEVYSAYTNFVRTATRSKALETPVSYYYGDSYESGAKGVKVTDSIIESMNEENGLRFSSWSDWRIQHLLDYMTAVIDLSVRKAKMHGYTKFPEEVRVLGKTGMMFNMSGVPGNGTGLNPDGSLSFSKENSIDPNDAITLREEFAETAGFQCIGVSDAHIKALLDSDIIDYVIPYHKSGLNATLRKMAEINGWKDYESVQHAKNNPNAIKPEGAENWQTEPSFSEFFVGYDTGMSGIKAMRASADRYIELCKERGLTPKFNDFVGEDNYWKLLIDRKMINQKTGKLIVQKAVEPNFDFDTIKSIVKEYAENYDPEVETRATEYIQKHWNEVPKRIKDLKNGKVKHSVDTLANTTVAATPNSKLSDRDSDYLEAVNRDDMETAQKMVEEAAKAAGYDYHLYHGTNADFTEFDLRNHGGKHGKGEGYGIYLAANREISAPYGKNVIDSYTKFNRLAEGDKMTLSLSEVKKLIKKSCELEAKTMVDDGEYDSIADAIKDTWVSNYVYTYDYSSMSQVYSDVANILFKNNDNDGELINEMMASSGAHYDYNNAMNFYDRVLTPTTGIDGFHYIWGNKDGSGVQNDIYLAFNSNQIKSADPVTYDDNGNVIPLSKRFNAENDDIRYSERDSSKASYAPTFYSHMGKVVDGIRGEKMGADGVVSYLKGKGVKDEEIKWSGIEAFLDGKKSVTKEELQAFVAGSQLQIEEETLSNKEMPYSQEQLKQIAEYEAERDTLAESLKSEWKRIVGTDIPIVYFGADVEGAVVRNLLAAVDTKKGETEVDKRYKAAKAALRKCIENNDDYFGFDTEREAFQTAMRNPQDFMSSYELSSDDQEVFKDFIKAKKAYSMEEGIPIKEQRILIDIAASADRFNRKIAQVKTDHLEEEARHQTKYGDYVLRGGANYREVLFKIPDASYSNGAMYTHWDRTGVLAHARIQDMTTSDGKKMLFVEEIQSDWHNEGHKSGYIDESKKLTVDNTEMRHEGKWYNLYHDGHDLHQGISESFLAQRFSNGITEEEIHEGLVAEYNRSMEKRNGVELVPDAPFRNNYHEYVLKRLIRMAAEEGYDSIGWTTADIQSNRWSDEFAEGYRIEYDQDIPKFLRKYGKKWGATVGKTPLPSVESNIKLYDVNRQEEYSFTEWQKVVEQDLKAQGAPMRNLKYESDDNYWIAFDKVSGMEYDRAEIRKGDNSIWSMTIPDSMKESVLYEGQTLYSARTEDAENRNVIPNGTKVRAADRGNIGTVVGYDGDTNEYTIAFRNKDGLSATVRLNANTITPLRSAKKRDATIKSISKNDFARNTQHESARGITVETQDFADMGDNAPEAYWNEASRKIVLNAKAKRNAAMLLGHEMFHTLPKEVQRSIVNLYRSEANTDSAEFKEFKADRMKKYKELYARDGRNFTEADFWTEFAAESSETLFTSKRIIEKVSDRRPPIAKQILRWIRDSLRSIVMHEDYTYSAAAKAANLTVDTLRKAENMYAKALNMPTADNIPDVKAAPSYAVNADNMGYGENVGNVADNGETETEEKLSANEVYESGKKRSENVPWYDTASRFIREMWHKATRVMSKIPESGELGKFYSYFRNRVLAYKMHYEMSSDRAVRLMQKMFVVDPEAKGEKRHLSKEEYETFNKVVFFRDLKETAEIQMEKGDPVKLPGGITLENVLKTLDEIEITPRIQTALDKRRAVWDELKRKYIEAGAKIGYDLRGKLLRKDYFRHEVLKYATDNFKRSPKKMKANDKASYLRQRVGSEELINSDFASVEFIALQQMIYDTMTMDNILAEMKKQYDIKPKLVRQAKAKNRAAMDEYIRNEAKETLIKAEEKRIGRKLSKEEIKDLEPTFTLTDRDTLKYNSETQRTLSTYTGKMRWALEKLQTLAEDGALDEFGNDLAVESLMRGELNADVNELIQTIASSDTESDATVPALTYLKNARLKEKFVKETLGDKFATWETELKSMNEQAANAKDNTLASVQYKVFQPRDGRYMFAEEVVSADSLFTELGKKLSEKLETTTKTDTQEFLKEFMDENIQTIFKAGSPYEQWVIPETMVEVMTDISNKPKTDSTISKVMSAPLNFWKRWVTGLNPLRAARYHIRNIFGDAEAALTGNAKILSPKRVGNAWKDAWNGLVNGEFTDEFKEWYDMGGTSVTFTIQEMTSKEAQKVFEFLRPKGNETFKDMMKKFANAVAEFPEMANKFNEVRESVLRFSAYKVIKDELNENGGKVKNYYASKKAIVDGLPTIELKAMQLSQDLLGNYGGVSETGQFMRKYFVPFWSFMETNVKRYYRLLANPISGIAQGVKEKDTAKVTSNSTILAKQSAKALAVYMALAIWNALHNDDEEKLPESVRNIPHITLGSVNGHVIAFTRLGNLLDIGEWLGIDDLKIESAEELYQAPIDKAWSILTPYIKMPIELVTGQNHYPSIFNPTYIRDRWQYMANNLGVVDVYNFIAQKPVPQDSIVDTIANLFVYTYEEESTAYSDAVSMRYDFEGSSTTKSIPTPKSNALYYMKQAMRYGDTKKALKYMNDYFDEGGTGRGLVQSLAYLDPRYGISKEDEEKFYGSMNESNKEKFDLGVEFYEKYLELPSAVKSYLRNTKDAEKAREYMATYITNYVSK